MDAETSFNILSVWAHLTFVKRMVLLRVRGNMLSLWLFTHTHTPYIRTVTVVMFATNKSFKKIRFLFALSLTGVFIFAHSFFHSPKIGLSRKKKKNTEKKYSFGNGCDVKVINFLHFPYNTLRHRFHYAHTKSLE